MCEPRNRDNGASDIWALTAYCGKYPVPFFLGHPVYTVFEISFFISITDLVLQGVAAP